MIIRERESEVVLLSIIVSSGSVAGENSSVGGEHGFFYHICGAIHQIECKVKGSIRNI